MKPEDLNRNIEELGPALAEGAARRDEEDAFAAEGHAELKARGFMKMLIPAELGGIGATHAQSCDVLRRLARFDPSLALEVSMHTHAVGTLVFKHLHGAALASQTLERIAANDLVLVSTGGRDWLESNGELTRVEGGYRLSARKPFASGSPVGDLAVTSAPHLDPEEGWQVLHFAVPLDREGVTVGDDWVAHGMRATGSNTLRFDDVFVSDASVTLRRPRGEFASVWHVVLGVALPLIVAPYLGIAEAAAERALPWARRNAAEPAVQWAMGEVESALVVARTCHARMVDLAADLRFEPSPGLSQEMLALKTAAVGAVRAVTESAMEAAGGASFMRKTGLERLLRDARAGHYHPLPEKAQRQMAGRVALGLPPADLSRWA